MFARFDENPAMTLRVIKETKRYRRMDGQRENSQGSQVCMTRIPLCKIKHAVKLVKPRFFFRYSGKNIILCILKSEMPF